MTPRRALWILILILIPPFAAHSPAAPPRRLVSLIPAVTEMLFAMGQGDRLVGVSSYDRFPQEAARIRSVGGLLDPSVETILALKPDLVIVYATQSELKQRLERAAIPFFSYEHRTLSDIMSTIRALGVRIEAPEPAERLARSMEQAIANVRASVAGLDRPRTLLVFSREPGSLQNVTASGGYGFLHDMIETAGGADVFSDVKQQSVQASTEMILSRRPEAIVELRYGAAAATDAGQDTQAWDKLASLPAVKNRRVYVLTGDEFVVPGPRVVDAIRRLAAVLHPAAK
jgi:iron complex transport system substrate-binding protein